MNKFYISFLLFNLIVQFVHSQESERVTPESSIPSSLNIESQVSFQHNLTTPKLDYDLEPISKGHFKLIFVNQPSDYVHIKIYDIIGNLILSEETKYSLNNEIEYNFNEKNNKIYVVKVEAGEDRVVKKVNF